MAAMSSPGTSETTLPRLFRRRVTPRDGAEATFVEDFWRDLCVALGPCAGTMPLACRVRHTIKHVEPKRNGKGV